MCWVIMIYAAGCASTASESAGYRPLNRTALRASQPRSIIIVSSRSPGFTSQTAKGSVVNAGALGALMISLIPAQGTSSENEKEIKQTGVRDPAVSIRTAIVHGLAKRFSLLIMGGTATGADLLLEVRTTHWGIAPTRNGHYAVKYQGALRLVDNRSNTIVADGLCSSFLADSEGIPSYPELLKDDAALLKSELNLAAEFCIEDYRTRILGLY